MHKSVVGLLIFFSAGVVSAHEMLFQAPVDPAALTASCRRFGSRITNRSGDLVQHVGQDYCADRGTPVHAAGIGVVVFAQAEENHGLGYTVIIRHVLDRSLGLSNYIFTLYAHLDSIDVYEDQWVEPGQKIGTVGQTGEGSFQIDHLHFEVKTAGLLEAPDPNGLSQVPEYGYTANPPDQMGYVNPAKFLFNKDWRGVHIHDADGPSRSGRHYVEGHFSSMGEVSADSLPLRDILWTQNRIDFNIFQDGRTLENFSSPLSLLLVPGDDSRFDNIWFPFQDVEPNHWYASPATKSWARNIVSGESGLLVPLRNANFAEFLKMLIEASPNLQHVACVEGERPVTVFSIAEFPPFHTGSPWYCGYYKAAVQAGWIDSFLSIAGQRGRPAQSIQRQEAAFFIAESLPQDEDREDIRFSDVTDGNLFYDAIRRCAARGIFRGYSDGRFGMGREIIRAEIVKILEQTFYPNVNK